MTDIKKGLLVMRGEEWLMKKSRDFYKEFQERTQKDSMRTREQPLR